MNWTYFIILLVVGIILYVGWMFFSQREVAYLSILLYRKGDADAYLKELNTFEGRLYFNKRLRALMSIDAWIIKGDKEKLEAAFEEARNGHLQTGDRLLVLQKELVYCVENDKNDRAKDVMSDIEKLYENMVKKQQEKYLNTVQECRYTSAIYLDHSGKYADEIEKKAKAVKDVIPAGVYFYKAAQSWYLKKETKKCREDLEKAYQKLKGSENEQAIKKMLDDEDYSHILDIHL